MCTASIYVCAWCIDVLARRWRCVLSGGWSRIIRTMSWWEEVCATGGAACQHIHTYTYIHTHAHSHDCGPDFYPALLVTLAHWERGKKCWYILAVWAYLKYDSSCLHLSKMYLCSMSLWSDAVEPRAGDGGMPWILLGGGGVVRIWTWGIRDMVRWEPDVASPLCHLHHHLVCNNYQCCVTAGAMYLMMSHPIISRALCSAYCRSSKSNIKPPTGQNRLATL